MEWIELKSQESIDNFMNEFYGFHDSCIKECSYVTGMLVDENKKSMGYNKDSSNIKLIVQSQWYDTIEIFFEYIKEANIYTYNNDNYFNDIFGATFYIENDLVYWANISNWNHSSPSENVTYIVCENVKYRKI